MRHFKILLIGLMFLVSACEESGTSSSTEIVKAPDETIDFWDITTADKELCYSSNFRGVYDSGSGVDLEFDGDCNGHSNYCNQDFIYKIDLENDKVYLNANLNNGNLGCIPAEEIECEISGYGSNPVRLQMECDGGIDFDLPAIEWQGVPQ